MWKGKEGRRGPTTHLDYVHGNGAPRLVAILDVTFQIHIEELEHEVELLVGVDDIEEPTWVDVRRRE